jgi:hypothetical protein
VCSQKCGNGVVASARSQKKVSLLTAGLLCATSVFSVSLWLLFLRHN